MADFNLAPIKLISENGDGLPQVAIDGKYVGGGLKTITVTGAGSDPSASGYADAVASTVANELPTQGLDTGTFVFDTTTSAIFRCIQASPSLQFTREFAGVTPADIDLVGYAKISDLPTDPNTGGIDIASEATLQDALLSSVRVDNSGNLNIAFSTETLGPNDPAFRFTVDSGVDVSLSTPAQISLRLNDAANDPFSV